MSRHSRRDCQPWLPRVWCSLSLCFEQRAACAEIFCLLCERGFGAPVWVFVRTRISSCLVAKFRAGAPSLELGAWRLAAPARWWKAKKESAGGAPGGFLRFRLARAARIKLFVLSSLFFFFFPFFFSFSFLLCFIDCDLCGIQVCVNVYAWFVYPRAVSLPFSRK